MNKPAVGDVIRLVNPERSTGDPLQWYQLVIQTHDSLDENWDPYGESAWSQRDHDDEEGKTGDWYVIATPCDVNGAPTYEGATCSFASYEVRKN